MNANCIQKALIVRIWNWLYKVLISQGNSNPGIVDSAPNNQNKVVIEYTHIWNSVCRQVIHMQYQAPQVTRWYYRKFNFNWIIFTLKLSLAPTIGLASSKISHLEQSSRSTSTSQIYLPYFYFSNCLTYILFIFLQFSSKLVTNWQIHSEDQYCVVLKNGKHENIMYRVRLQVHKKLTTSQRNIFRSD